jgi:hypothetical protein
MNKTLFFPIHTIEILRMDSALFESCCFNAVADVSAPMRRGEGGEGA